MAELTWGELMKHLEAAGQEIRAEERARCDRLIDLIAAERSDEKNFWHAQIVKARAEERERCAKIAERLASHSNAEIAHAAQALADEIRNSN